MKLYRIRNWGHFETNRTRVLKNLSWVPIPNDLASDGYTDLMEHQNGIGYFGVFIVCVEVASKCEPRGDLIRRDGTPHDLKSLSRITRIPLEWLKDAFVHLLRVKWVEEVDGDVVPAPRCHDGAGLWHDGAAKTSTKERKKGMKEGKEKNHHHRVMMEEWFKLHLARYGIKPTVTGAATRTIKLLAGMPDGTRVLKAYYADDDDFIIRHAHSLQLLPARLDGYRASLAPHTKDISESEAADVIAAIKQKGSNGRQTNRSPDAGPAGEKLDEAQPDRSGDGTPVR
jgi:hypothetical protein